MARLSLSADMQPNPHSSRWSIRIYFINIWSDFLFQWKIFLPSGATLHFQLRCKLLLTMYRKWLKAEIKHAKNALNQNEA